MSAETTTAEPPANTTEVVIEKPSFGVPPAQGLQFNSMSELLTKGRKTQATTEKPNAEPEKAQETPEVKKPTEPDPEVKKEPETAPKVSKEESLANLRKAREQAERERDELKEKYAAIERERDELKAKPFELPEEFKTKLTTLEQEREAYAKELRAAKLERDPEFVGKYQKSIETHVEMMSRIAKEAGISDAEVKQGMGAWSGTAFGEWSEQMTPEQRIKFSAAWLESERLWQERQQKLTEADKTWAELQKSREDEMKSQHQAYLEGNTKVAKNLLKQIILDNEALKEYDDLPGAAEAMAMKAARHEMTPEEVFQNVIHNQVLARVTVKQKAALEAKDTTIEEQKKKIAELEAFVQEHAGATPRTSAAGIAQKGAKDDAPIWNRIQVRP